jgi:hypothetical protein
MYIQLAHTRMEISTWHIHSLVYKITTCLKLTAVVAKIKFLIHEMGFEKSNHLSVQKKVKGILFAYAFFGYEKYL